jgi:hypothetical protein
VQVSRVEGTVADQCADRVHRQRRHPHSPGGPLRGQIAEHQPERMIIAELVVAVGSQQ